MQFILRALRHNFLTSDKKFHEFFYPTHMNAGNFIIGLIFGYIIHNKAQLCRLTSYTFVYLPIFLLVPAAFKYYFTLNYVKSSIGTALLGAYLKHHEGIFLSIILFNLLYRNDGGRLASWLSHSNFQILDKLFTSAFFIQFLVTKFFIVNTRVLLEVSTMNMVILFINFDNSLIVRLFSVFLRMWYHGCELSNSTDNSHNFPSSISARQRRHSEEGNEREKGRVIM
jgi:hypothetical protein